MVFRVSHVNGGASRRRESEFQDIALRSEEKGLVLDIEA